MTHDDAFLREIIARPAEDAPRLIYADWLDEHGQGERAEFIRVQCRLAGYIGPKTGVNCCEGKGPPAHAGSRKRCRCEPCVLVRREEELWRLEANNEWYIPSPQSHLFAGVLAQNHLAKSESVSLIIFRRGFPEMAQCKAADWMAHADALTAAAPIREVRLTTMPEEATNGRLFSERRRRLKGRQTWYWDRADRKPNWCATEATEAGIVLGLLRAEFGERIKFTLPRDPSLGVEGQVRRLHGPVNR